MKTLIRLFIGFHAALYRLTKGGFGSRMQGMPVLLLTHTGRKSGKQRTVPLMYIRDGERYVITASAGGADHHPAWYLNLKSVPQTQIQVGDQVLTTVAEEVGPEDKPRLWSQLVSKAAFFNDYQQHTQREIPMVALHPIT